MICGHIHQPQKKTYRNHQGACVYLNSGDWIENLSALEYANGDWQLCFPKMNEEESEDLIEADLNGLDLQRIIDKVTMQNLNA